jgi:hypothetical protein
MSQASQHGVERPDGQAVFTTLFEFVYIVLQVALAVGRVNPRLSATAGLNFQRPAHILGRDQGVRPRVLAVPIYQESSVEDLDSLVGIEGRRNLGDRAQVTVDELHQASVVVNRAGPAATADVQFVARHTEGILHVDQDQDDPERILGGRAQVVALRPLAALGGSGFVRHLPDLADLFNIKVRREWKFREEGVVGHEYPR